MFVATTNYKIQCTTNFKFRMQDNKQNIKTVEYQKHPSFRETTKINESTAFKQVWNRYIHIHNIWLNDNKNLLQQKNKWLLQQDLYPCLQNICQVNRTITFSVKVSDIRYTLFILNKQINQRMWKCKVYDVKYQRPHTRFTCLQICYALLQWWQ